MKRTVHKVLSMNVVQGQRDLPRPRQPLAKGRPTVALFSAEGLFHILLQAAVVGKVRHKEVPVMTMMMMTTTMMHEEPC